MSPGRCRNGGISAVMTLSRKKEVLAKGPFGEALFEIAAGGGDDAYIGLADHVFTHPLVFTFLQQAQQLGLDLQWQVTDLIEKKGSARGRFDFAPMVA